MGSSVTIVCFVGGTAGDIITQLLDPGALTTERQRLKKPHLFASDCEKDLFLKAIGFASIPSHDFEYHYKNNHNVLGIACRSLTDAIWAANRFKKLHSPHVWQEMSISCGANTVEEYAQTIMDFGNMISDYTSNVLYLDDIVNGYAVARLQAMGYQTPGTNKYKEWLSTQHD